MSSQGGSGQGGQRPELGSIRTELLVAFIFAIIAAIIYLVEMGIIFAGAAAMGAYGFGVGVGMFVGIGIVWLILLIIDIVVLLRIYRMYKAAGSGDVATLKSLNSIGWAIIALLFSGLIPGIMLLIAHGPIERL
ncbi:hypothetical protein [Vulcanisaeta sp. JCM 16159]|uniref:hypothetical protein n=1 Tax=Vulcanisaeta sp. JCM 16159 TaxID=1295371 RepID=UPI0006D0A348|nr:hypothetical protein [Vulcanisaeta sp. JCM 16159]